MDDTSEPATLRARARHFAESNLFQRTILVIIMVNAIVLGIETSEAAMTSYGPLLVALDQIALTIFVAEILLKLYALGLGYFRNPWNLFDFTIIAIALLPVSEGLAVLRALRVLRAFRLISMVPKMRLVVQAFLKAIPGMGAIMLVLGVIFYVASVMGAKLFSGTHPQFFGDLGGSAYTLFQVMTLESWSMGVARPVIAEHPYAWIYFVGFVIVTSFAVLNLFIAVIVDSMQSKHFDAETERQNEAHDEREVLIHEVRALRQVLCVRFV